MTTTGTLSTQEAWSDDVVLIDLTPPDVARVHPRRSRWTALLIVILTVLTGAGLATSTIVPRPLDHTAAGGRPSQPPADAVVGSRSLPIGAPAGGLGSDVSVPAVLANARTKRDPHGGTMVHVSGTASVTATQIEVRVLRAGIEIGRSAIRIDPDATLPARLWPSDVGIAPWSTDVVLGDGWATSTVDAVAIVEVRWNAVPSGPGGLERLFVTLSDGRKSDV